MQKVYFASAAVAACLSVAFGKSVYAADMPPRPVYKPPVVVAPVLPWMGCYAGGNVGAAWGGGSISSGAGSVSGNSDAAFTGGGQIGCDYQAGTVVFGMRNLFNWSALERTGTMGAGGSVTAKNNWLDLLTARIGFAAQPNWLLYFQGGVAWSNGSVQQFTPAGASVGEVSNTRTGWTVGLGSEYKVTPNWSFFAEYNYVDFGNNNVTIPAGTTFSVNTHISQVLLGVNYRF